MHLFKLPGTYVYTFAEAGGEIMRKISACIFII